MTIRTKLLIVLLLLSVGVMATAGIFFTFTIDRFLQDRILHELETQAAEFDYIVRSGTFDGEPSYHHLQALARAANIRLTLIDSAGTVIFESDLSPEDLPKIENHLDRPEVQAAMRTDSGTDARVSATVHKEMLYLARRIREPVSTASAYSHTALLRVGIPLTQVSDLKREVKVIVVWSSAGVLVLIIVVTIIVSGRLARPIHNMARIADEIRRGNLDQRIPIRSRDEFGRLGQSLNAMIDKLNEDIVRLKKLERVRTEFLGNVSHELRTPIFAIQGMLETLLQGAIDDPNVSRDFAERALTNTQRLNALLADLIEISRIESGDMKMSFRYFPIKDFLVSIVASMVLLAEQKQITLRLHPDTIESDVLGDKERLKQVMINLIDNAIKYTPAGGSVTVVAAASNNGVRVSVQDSGVGISAEHLPRIFERFYRVDKERSRDAGGTGLGLAIVKHIVEAHGSKVEVQSALAQGSVFSFVLRT
jgi:two-component system phosphate regulon sensor histidine kinase PhoR